MSDAPYFEDIARAPSGGRTYWVHARDGVRIRVGVWQTGSRGTALIFPGRTEYIEKYGPIVGRLAQIGLSAAVIDWRGQGLADRPDDNTGIGYVEEFDDYQTDVDALLACDAVALLPEPKVLLAHSMGGAIGLRALHNRLPVTGAIFSAPMWGVGSSPEFRAMARVITGLATACGAGKRHIPGSDDGFHTLNTPFEDSRLTNCAETYAWLQEQLRAHPELGLGGLTYRWVNRALRETATLLAKLPAIQPTLTFFGTDETVVDPDIIRQYHAKAGAGRLLRVDGGKHEILMDREALQAPVWSAIGEFVDEVLPD